MSDLRIHCERKSCKRTAPADKLPEFTAIICAKCWKLVPQRLRSRQRHLRRLARSKRGQRDDIYRRRCYEADNRNWDAMVAYLNNPPRPEGLESFIEETGIGA